MPDAGNLPGTQPDPSEAVRTELIGVVRALATAGLLVGTAGNVSCREPDGQAFWITPSGLDSSTLRGQDLVRVLQGSGEAIGCHPPSTEVELHRLAYARRTDVQAIVHYHAPYVCALAVARRGIPDILGESLDLTPVPLAPHAPAGTRELAEIVAGVAAKGHAAILLANHGALLLASNLQEALAQSVALERLALIYLLAEQGGGAVRIEPRAAERGRQGLRAYLARQSGT